MVKLTLQNRMQPHCLALAWLVDEAGGCATVKDVATAVLGPKRAAAMVRHLLPMSGAGWVATEDGEDKRLSSGTVTVTPLGYMWRDYLRVRPLPYRLNTIENHTHLRAYQLALEPLAAAGRAWKAATEAERIGMRIAFDNLNISPLQAMIATTVLDSTDDVEVVYPWTPGKMLAQGSSMLRHHTPSPRRAK